MTEPPELYLKYRPKKLSHVRGQAKSIAVLTDMAKRKAIPHVLLFVGPSGTGKTTLARIVAAKLKCTGNDFAEINAAEQRGIDMVRDLNQRIGLAPMNGPCRVWLIDECHALTSDAQSALLKILEDTPAHVYFFLATTDPQKLKDTVTTRCTKIKCEELKTDDIVGLVTSVFKAETGGDVNDGVAHRIAEVAQGSAREALVILHSVIGQQTTEKQLEAVQSIDVRADAFEICRLFMQPRTTWAEVAEVLRDSDADPEQVRYMILGYFRKVLLGSQGGSGKAKRAAAIIEIFQYNFFDSKAAGLAAACYSVVEGGK